MSHPDERSADMGASEETGRLDQLYDLLARSRSHVQRLEEMIAEEEGVSPAALLARRRRVIRVVA